MSHSGTFGSFGGGKFPFGPGTVGRSLNVRQEQEAMRMLNGGGYSSMSNEYRMQMASPPTSNFSAGLA